jgi:hypothetical protein
MVPAIDFTVAPPIDPNRLSRALRLNAKPSGALGRYYVWGGTEPHWVDLYTEQNPRCDCGDHEWRQLICKHMLAALLREGDHHAIESLNVWAARLLYMAGDETGGLGS